MTFPVGGFTRISLIYRTRLPGNEHAILPVDSIVATVNQGLQDLDALVIQQHSDQAHFNYAAPGAAGGKFSYPNNPVLISFTDDVGRPTYKDAMAALQGIAQAAQQLNLVEEASIEIKRAYSGIEVQRGRIDFTGKTVVELDSAATE